MIFKVVLMLKVKMNFRSKLFQTSSVCISGFFIIIIIKLEQ